MDYCVLNGRKEEKGDFMYFINYKIHKIPIFLFPTIQYTDNPICMIYFCVFLHCSVYDRSYRSGRSNGAFCNLKGPQMISQVLETDLLQDIMNERFAPSN